MWQPHLPVGKEQGPDKDGAPGANGYPPLPRFYQRNGQLIITQANPNVQGQCSCAHPFL
jgi:hypothetical protein